MKKSMNDEYLLYVLTMSLPSNNVGINQFLSKTRRAIEKTPKLFNRLMIKRQEVTAHDTGSDQWHKTIAIQPEEARLIAAFTHIAKALYFHEFGKVWSGTVRVLIEFMLSLTNLKQNKSEARAVREVNTLLEGVRHAGENPEVFSYQLREFDAHALLRLHFYGNSKVSAFLLP